jgi:hypothetical protein
MRVKLASVKESAVERELRIRVEALGGVCEKVRVIGRRGFFDRLVALPGGVVVFVELKHPKRGRLSRHQIWYAERYRILGLAIAVVRNSADIDALLKKKWAGAVPTPHGPI